MKADVTLHLTPDQALVFFEWLVREDKGQGLPRVHQAERDVLWALEAQLESALLEPLSPGYAAAVAAARERLASGDDGIAASSGVRAASLSRSETS